MHWDQRIFIAELNIEHFRLKLAGELDDAQRRTIFALLAEEEAKLLNLKAAAAERELSILIDLIAQRAVELFSGAPPKPPQKARDDVRAVINRVPVGMGVMNSAGEMILCNEGMQVFVPDGRVSWDHLRHFRTMAGPLSPPIWPGARALHGEVVNPGQEFVFIGADGREAEVRVAAVPIHNGDASIAGAITAIYDLSTLGGGETGQGLALLVAEETGGLNGGPKA
jgi:PAS domain-containing protein